MEVLEPKGTLALAKECWQRASGQKEHAVFSSAKEFFAAAVILVGHPFVTTGFMNQLEELCTELTINPFKTVIVEAAAAEPAPPVRRVAPVVCTTNALPKCVIV